MENSSHLKSKYVLDRKLGEGTYGTVVKALRKETGQPVAIKYFRHEVSDDYIDSNPETKVLLILGNHPNVIKLHEVFREEGKLYLVFEYMNLDLRNLITHRVNNVSESQTRQICFQLLKGLDHIHSHNFMHRDLKPENILVNGDDVKIADFGSSVAITPFTEDTNKGTTLGYRAPEVLLGDEYFGAAVDMWAFGAVMGELYLGTSLFRGSDEPDQVTQICRVMGTPSRFDCPLSYELAEGIGYKFPRYKGWIQAELMSKASKPAIDLIKSLLSWDANKRPTAKQALKHPFFDPCYQPESTSSFASSWCAQGNVPISGRARNFLKWCTVLKTNKSMRICMN